MDHNGELIAVRRGFVSIFMREMHRRIPYQGIFALFQLIYFVLPMAFALIVVPLRAMEIISPAQFMFIMILEGAISSYVYLRIVLFDHASTVACLREIFTQYPSMRFDLRRSAKMQWMDD